LADEGEALAEAAEGTEEQAITEAGVGTGFSIANALFMSLSTGVTQSLCFTPGVSALSLDCTQSVEPRAF
jgi:hypothetical protein